MNIQVNLLPEAKLNKIRNKSKKRTYTTFTILLAIIIVIAAALLIMLRVFLLGTYQVGKNKISSLKTEVGKSKDMEESAATLQQNLASFYNLNAKRTNASRIISNFFKAVPANVTISSISLNDKGAFTVSGSTATFADVSRFASSLEQYNLDYLPQPDLDRAQVFTSVSINSVNKNEGRTDFSITFTVNEAVLKNQRKQ
jgi:hypothetical protein